ncbi:extracellular catalytic domain type 2 short-chain-length polyhydroxyalkanoate depolymerase [Ralstonia sp. A12]|uniref:extracellular catalytic domain type 2 short-chain-length polyhydroxyalkanoate depolymerase n=1 Tax=Ralstonia sp. A12 TaxID=1217052 RepID=UPI0009FE94B6|nr:poly(3-hydroxybutyrate) depolymerase [Ralstonia sp. A12]
MQHTAKHLPRPKKTPSTRLRARALAYVIAGIALTATTLCRASSADDAPLGAYNADLKRVSVSGLSSGGFMTAQFDVAYSSELIGAGIIAGGPYHCAGLSKLVPPFTAAATLCMQPVGPAPSAEDAWRDAQAFAKKGLIDDPANLRTQRIYVFSGGKDSVVSTRVVNQTARFYELAGVPNRQVYYNRIPDAGHAFITNQPSDAACSSNRNPYINNCGFRQSHDIVRWIYGTAGTPVKAPAQVARGKLLAFDQTPFDTTHRASLLQTGFVYVPADCEAGGCAVHVVFHGCTQSVQTIGDRLVRGVGYNEIADTNRLIVLYPQVAKSSANPLGCWDFWGYTSADPDRPDFYTRQAPQMAAVMQMIRHLGQTRP